MVLREGMGANVQVSVCAGRLSVDNDDMKVRVPKEELAKYFIGKERASYVYDVGLPDLIELEGEVVERTESYGVSTDDNGKPVLGQWPVKVEEKQSCSHVWSVYTWEGHRVCAACNALSEKSLPPLPDEHCTKCRCEKRLCDYGNNHCELANCMCHEKEKYEPGSEKDEWPISPEEIALVKALNCYFKARDGHKEI